MMDESMNSVSLKSTTTASRSKRDASVSLTSAAVVRLCPPRRETTTMPCPARAIRSSGLISGASVKTSSFLRRLSDHAFFYPRPVGV